MGPETKSGDPETPGTPETHKVGRGQSPASRANLRPGDWRSKQEPDGPEKPIKTVDGIDRYSDDSNRVTAQLVWEHLDADALPAGAGRASSLWEWARKNKDEFFSKFVPMLIRTEQDAAPKWDGKSPCPVCKREPEGVDEGEERAREHLQAFLKGMAAPTYKEKDITALVVAAHSLDEALGGGGPAQVAEGQVRLRGAISPVLRGLSPMQRKDFEAASVAHGV